MIDRLECRPYAQGHESAILALFRASFGKEMSREFWQWRYQGNPTGQVMVELAWEEDKIAAHYAVSPIVLSIKGRDSLSGLSMTTMTHPNYRGRRLFPLLANLLYERMKESGFLLVWGFPNNESHRGFIRHLAWEHIYEIPTFHLNINAISTFPKVSGHITELDEFDPRFDSLWEQVRLDNDIWVKRDRKYLNWRYTLNPQHEYHILAYVDNSEMLGYAVYKIYGSGIDVVDIVTVREDNIGEELIISIVDMALQQGNIKGINMWFPLHRTLHHCLEKIAFQNNVPVTYFGARVLDDSRQYDVDFTKYSNWFVQLGDSDVY